MFVLNTLPELKVTACTTESKAIRLADKTQGLLVRVPEDLKHVPDHILVRMFNAALGKDEKPMVKFPDKPTAIAKVWDVMGPLSWAGTIPKGTKTGAVPKEAKKAKGAPKAEAKRVAAFGVSRLSGQKLFRKTKKNPRKEHSHGWYSFSKIKDGMTYEEYLAAGGRRQDLAWDLTHGFVEVK